ncbi:glycine--tRNA ligase subunit beta [Roseomonas sp. CCTCC AB2023176]|uniref:glycine--tRNA ligase subunit beta n=1 Tax=Roseomonas sp. CCTCC AB2023176 TaxID=3342640 RepID=UPI0035DB918F
MSDLLLELFSEEIPARMQARAAEDLLALVMETLSPLLGEGGTVRSYHGPRRIALGVDGLRAEVPAERVEERGPRTGAPEAALAGFLKKNGAAREDVVEDGGYWVLRRERPAVPLAHVVAEAVPRAIRRLPWPKSMRWGTSELTWVRPLQRILCVLDGAVVPFSLAQGGDASHGLASADLTEGHRIMAGTVPFAVTGRADYEAGLRERHVVPDAAERERIIEDGVAALAAVEGLEVVPDRGLLAEVAGLVEWPVPLLGRIDDAFMDLPPEVMRTTMRVNQRYFALRHPDGRAAARFALVANIAAKDGGDAIVAGNERVLRARLSDARFFWDLDRQQRLDDFLPKLEGVVFHAKLGTQADRVLRLERLARHIAPMVGADPELAARAARLAKADLATGMVGEFPELQGVMGRYYALHGGEDPRVAEAIGAHYKPLGPGDAVPTEPVAIAVALADKLDQLAGFFAVDERPTGSGDPYALRRSALGLIRMVRENGLRLPLKDVFEFALFSDRPDQIMMTIAGTLLSVAAQPEIAARGDLERATGKRLGSFGQGLSLPLAEIVAGLMDFLADRLRVQLRADGARHDLVTAVFGTSGDDDLNRLLARADAVRDFLATSDGADLLTAYRRAANILRIEERKDKATYPAQVDPDMLALGEERALGAALDTARPAATAALAREDFAGAMAALAPLRAPVDAFFDRVTVNDPDANLRRNRLGLLALLRDAMNDVADFSKIEA